MSKRPVWGSLLALSLVLGACTGDVDFGSGIGDDSGAPIQPAGDAGKTSGPDGGNVVPGDGDGDSTDPGDGDSTGPGDGDGTTTPVDPEVEGMKGMLRAHNAVRAGLNTSPALEPLTWSSEIAKVAQAYAEKLAGTCGSLVHSTDGKYGENLAAFSYKTEPKASVDAWESELACYTYAKIGSPDCSAACTSCGHYTQLVWRNTKRVGCGVASCVKRTYWVCNYEPPGNYRGQYPY